MITIDEKALRELIVSAVKEALAAQPASEKKPEKPKAKAPEPMTYDKFMDSLRAHLREQDDVAAATERAKNIALDSYGADKFSQVKAEDLPALLSEIKHVQS